jgi:DNA phosphorothioation-dependent restriction protein DptH
MTKGIRDISAQDLNAELCGLLQPRLAASLRARGPGHCMRVQDLDDALTSRLCSALRAEVSDAAVVILADQHATDVADPYVSPTKLVELRNPEADGSLRPPLLVFIPSGLRAAAEDSFGVATFEELDLSDAYRELEDQMIAALGEPYRGIAAQLLRDLRGDARSGLFADSAAAVRWLLTARANGNAPETLGAALFHLGLIPDFEWLLDPLKAPQQARNNRSKVEKITWSPLSERGRVQELELKDGGFRNRFGGFLEETGTESPRHWTRRIAMDPSCWQFSFDKWEFVSEQTPDHVCIYNVDTGLPIAEPSEENPAIDALAGQRYLPLGPNGLTKFTASFQVEPHPQSVQGLERFVVHVVSVDSGPIGFSRKKSAWRPKTLRATVTFSNLGKVAWEEGWHFLRVVAETADGEPITLVDADGNMVLEGPSDTGQRPANTSDLFYVLPEGDIDVEPPQRAVQRSPGLLHALFQLQFAALSGGRDPNLVRPGEPRWVDRNSRDLDLLEVPFGREGTRAIPVSKRLREIEQRILREPEGPVCWRLVIGHDGAESATEDALPWPSAPLTEELKTARAAYLAGIAGDAGGLVSEAADFRDLLEEALGYADAFARLVEELRRLAERGHAALAELHALLRLDTVAVVLGDHRGQTREALLLAPTHPLRALWYALWAKLGEHWLAASAGLAPTRVTAVRDALLRYLTPAGFPAVLPVGSGRLFVLVDNLSPFWSLYAPSTEADPRGLLGQLCSALGLPEPGIGGSVIDGEYLASRFERYLAQHPYVGTLTVNAFNAGRAGVIAEALLALEREPHLRDLRYDIRLFAPDSASPALAEGLTELLNPSASTTVAEADAFCTPAEDHLSPKLAVAVRGIGDYLGHPDHYRAHLTLLFDVFAASEVGATPGDRRDGVAPVHGLVLDMATEYQEDESLVAWRRHPRFGVPLPIAELADETRLLARLGLVLANATANVATGRSGMDLRPQLTLALSPDHKALLHLVHEHSDWVFTVDRNMGIEYFDHGGPTGRRRSQRPEYLIDHSPDIRQNAGPNLAISSRSLHEVEAMLAPVLHAFELPADRAYAVLLLDQLRSLSGRLALKLVSAPNQQAEAMGLALSRLFLEDQGVFADQIVVPLDAHLELYRSAKAAADEVGEAMSFKRTDLALFDLDPRRREIVCRLVEVKCYRQVADLFGSASLRQAIAEQIGESERVLAGHFDLDADGQRRPDHVVKSRELNVLLDFYLARAERYELVSAAAAEEARFFLRTIDEGYRLSFTRTGLVFDFAKDGLDQPDVDLGVEFHRIGADRIKGLLAAACAVATASDAVPGLMAAPAPREPTVPVLRTAAFLSPPRDRTVDWESFASPDGLRTGTVGADTAASSLAVSPTSFVTGAASAPAAPTVPGTVEQVAKRSEASARGADSSGQDKRIAESAVPTPYVEPGQAPVDRPLPVRSGADATDRLGTDRPPDYDILLGKREPSPQYGLLGETQGRRVALDLNETHTISLFGVQGAGKSYTLGAMVEMALRPLPGINALPKPLGGVIFHYSPTMDYAPEFTSMVRPNSKAEELELLRERYGAEPTRLDDVLIIAPEAQVEERRREFPGIEVTPLRFSAAELQVKHWTFLMGAVGNQALYLRQLKQIMKEIRRDLNLDGLRDGIERSRMAENLKELARTRLDFAADYIADGASITALFRPGRLVIVDLRDELMEKDEALGLFVVLLHLVAEATWNGERFNKLVVFDEAHKYIQNPDLVDGLVEVIREMRHKGTSILIASQDPQSVQVKVIELSTQIILHKFNSPAWLKHVQKANAALSGLTAERMAALRPGEAFAWSSKASDDGCTRAPIKLRCRPRVTAHGGATRTAVDDATPG